MKLHIHCFRWPRAAGAVPLKARLCCLLLFPQGALREGAGRIGTNFSTNLDNYKKSLAQVEVEVGAARLQGVRRLHWKLVSCGCLHLAEEHTNC